MNHALTWKVRAHTRPSSTRKGASHRWRMMQWMHATKMQYLHICNGMEMQWTCMTHALYYNDAWHMHVFLFLDFFEMHDICSIYKWCMTMHYDATTMIAAFPILPTGRYTRLVQYPELRRKHAASTYGASIQISSRGYTPWVFKPDFSPGNSEPSRSRRKPFEL